jgi:hypothetical protein
VDIKQRDYIEERLKIIHLAYSRVFLESVLDTKRFLEVLAKNIMLEEIPNPTDILPEADGRICLEWSKITTKGKLDLFNIYFNGDGTIVYEAFLDSLGTELKKNTEIKEDLDEVLLIHIKHFS